MSYFIFSNQKRIKMRALSFLFVFIPSSAFSWGPIGHRVVGAVAENHLTPQAKKQVQALLGDLTLADAGTWADEMRSDPAYVSYAPWHYVSVPDNETYQLDSVQDNVIEGVRKTAEKLADTKAAQAERAEALKFLVHFVGDLHQPLHVGRAEDRGGNEIAVLWFGKSQQLHYVWDVSIIEQEALSYSELARWVDYPRAEDKQWLQSGILEWAKESQDLRPLVYEFRNKFLTPREIEKVLTSPIPQEFKETPKLSYQYFGRAKPIVRQRLYQAGIRLAKLINEALP